MQKSTIELLKNFAGINQSILFRPGSVLKTISIMKNVFAEAVVDDEFTREFAIYDLNEFLATLALFEAPEFNYEENYLVIKSGRNKVKYHYSSPSVIVSPPLDKKIEIEGDIKFTLTKEMLEKLLKAASVMNLEDMEIHSTGYTAFNKNNVGNQIDVEVEDMEVTGKAKSKILKIINLKMMPGDYQVNASDRAVEFKAKDGSKTYFVGVESD